MKRQRYFPETESDRLEKLFCGDLRSGLRRLAWEELMAADTEIKGGPIA